MSVVTLHGRIKPEKLGKVAVHEHLHQDFRDSFKKSEHCTFDSNLRLADMTPHQTAMARVYPYHFYDNLDLTDYGAVLADLKEFKRLGGGAICEVSSSGYKRDHLHVANLSTDSGVHIIMGTSNYPTTQSTTASIEEMSNFIRSELENGFNQENQYFPGLIGEIECSYPLTLNNRRHLEAVADQDKSVPISIHPGRHIEAPLEIVRILSEAGANEEKISMGHLDRTLLTNEQLGDFADETKCFLQFDLFGIEQSYYQMAKVFMPNDGMRLNHMKYMIENHNCADRLMISSDIWRKNRLLAYGGVGYGHILRTVTPQAIEIAKIDKNDWKMILENNPQKWLSR